MTEKKVCFFVAPIGEEGTKDRERSDQIRDFVVKPAVDPFGYTVIRADEISKSGMITSQIIEHLFESALVIADIGTNNPNVFYELALRHAVRKPFIQIYEEGQAIPFDVSSLRSVPLRFPDLRSAEKCRKEIAAQIKQLQNNPADVESPVSVAIDVKALASSGNVVDKKLAILIEMVEDLRGQVQMLKAASGVADFYFENTGSVPLSILGKPVDFPSSGAFTIKVNPFRPRREFLKGNPIVRGGPRPDVSTEDSGSESKKKEEE